MRTAALLVVALGLIAGCVDKERGLVENPYEFCKQQVMGPEQAVNECIQSYVQSLCAKQGLQRGSGQFAQCTRDLSQAALVRSQVDNFRLPNR
ncbi:MAG: hypothetical protein QNJ94_06870 [Alphaproteobacteria bacterium]|nr:hypothetical protein [Alphaproteobacteria bacterium]